MSLSTRRAAFLFLVVSVAACDHGPAPAGELTTRTSPLISDQAHGGGLPGFLFLPPLVPNPGATGGAFEPRLSPVVRIDRVDPATGATLATLVTYDTARRVHGSKVRRNARRGFYVVRWKTRDFDLDTAATYRIRVLIDGHELGFADVDVVGTARELRNVDRGLFVPLKDGTTLPIRFRVESRAVDRDGDGVWDWADNCPDTPNGRGPAPWAGASSEPASGCDPDGDECDPDEEDCDGGAPWSQLDSDGDGVGDACECLGVTCEPVAGCDAAGTCDPRTGACVAPEDCGSGGCLDDPASCDDGDACNGVEACDAAGACVAGTPPTVDDGDPCTIDACDPVDGVTHAPATGMACDDGDDCTAEDACSDGACVGAPVPGCCSLPPGATPESPEETCDDGVDNDCDGQTDAADSDCAPGRWFYTCGNPACLGYVLPDGVPVCSFQTPGDPCADLGAQCAVVGDPCNRRQICSDSDPTSSGCPICAAPDTPVATPEGDRPIASLRPGDLVYSVDDGAIVAVPLARVGQTPVSAHHVVRVVLDGGAVLEISPGHPTADGRTFG
ncbi:MAG: hypothetical protein KC635_20095, partial [Myxococcales bacterium]|nr:hypothetical protein [Myxococcales bacterium]